MIPKLLTRWYGVNRWPEADAIVASREEVFHHKYEEGPAASARITFYYRDLSGSIQGGHLKVDDESHLYNLRQNGAFRIRFDPKHPSRYYCQDAATYYSELPFVFWSIVGLVLLSVLIFWLVRSGAGK